MLIYYIFSVVLSHPEIVLLWALWPTEIEILKIFENQQILDSAVFKNSRVFRILDSKPMEI